MRFFPVMLGAIWFLLCATVTYRLSVGARPASSQVRVEPQAIAVPAAAQPHAAPQAAPAVPLPAAPAPALPAYSPQQPAAPPASGSWSATPAVPPPTAPPPVYASPQPIPSHYPEVEAEQRPSRRRRRASRRDAEAPGTAAEAQDSESPSARCQGVTKKGAQCRRKTRDPSGFCYQHQGG